MLNFGGVIGLLEMSTMSISQEAPLLTTQHNLVECFMLISSKVVVEMSATFNANSARLFGGSYSCQ